MDTSLLFALLPEDMASKFAIFDKSLSPEEQFELFAAELFKETGIELKFDRDKSLTDNLKPIFDQLSVKEKIIAKKLLNVMEEQIKNKNLLNTKKEKTVTEVDGGDVNREQKKKIQSINTSDSPDSIFFK